eukprot:1284984-Rhodomonas_salina.1
MAGNGAASRMLVRRMQPIRMLSYSTTETSQKKEEPNQEEPKKPKKRVSHAFFTSWYTTPRVQILPDLFLATYDQTRSSDC